MMECRWWDSNPHGFPNDFESFASAIPPHRLIFNFETFVPVSEDWRDVQEGCKKSCFDKPSKFNAQSWISRTDKKNHEADFESTSSAIPTHRLIFNFKGYLWMLWKRLQCPEEAGLEDWRDVQEGCSVFAALGKPKKPHQSSTFQNRLSKWRKGFWVPLVCHSDTPAYSVLQTT